MSSTVYTDAPWNPERKGFPVHRYDDYDLSVATREQRTQPITSHSLPPLPYPESALEPHISRETVHFHHDVHQRGYVDKLNQLIANTEFEGCSLEEIVRTSSGAIFNNAGQAWNHDFYWQCLTPKGVGSPRGPLADAIRIAFGSHTGFQAEFARVATSLFGSGWTWLVQNPDRTLAIVHTGNAGSPIRSGQRPLLTCDAWEHAYYLDYRNRRADYLKAFWQLVNWQFVESRYIA